MEKNAKNCPSVEGVWTYSSLPHNPPPTKFESQEHLAMIVFELKI